MNRSALLLLIILAAFLSGCGQWIETKGDVKQTTYPAVVDNPQVREMNEVLSQVNDRTGVADAVDSFVSYIDTKLMNSNEAQASVEAMLGAELMEKLAVNEEILDISVVTDAVNVLGSAEGVRIDDAVVIAAKNAIEGSMPNLNPDRGMWITPLEASLIAYAIISGDDGTASTESVNIPREKILEYVNRIVE